jgi:hypothetical protein
MNNFVRFKAPRLIDERSENCGLRLAEGVDAASVDSLVERLVDQIGARVINSSDSDTERTWELDYSGTSLRLTFMAGQIQLDPVYASASCAIHDLHELFMIRSGPDGY